MTKKHATTCRFSRRSILIACICSRDELTEYEYMGGSSHIIEAKRAAGSPNSIWEFFVLFDASFGMERKGMG